MKKTAVITGGNRGIGFAIAYRLAQDGFNIAIMHVSEHEAHKQNLDKLAALSADYLCLRGNISESADRELLVSETVARFGGIHVLVNNAGVAPLKRQDLLEMTEESFDRVIGINTKGTMFMTQIVVNQMLKQEYTGANRGTVINISSCSAEVSSTGRGEYCVSKAGVSMLTTLYADRLASEGILVHEIRPGVIASDMTATVKAKYDAMFDTGVFPIARWGKPEDVADAAAVFAGDHFLYTTGNYVDVDGGFHIKRL